MSKGVPLVVFDFDHTLLDVNSEDSKTFARFIFKVFLNFYAKIIQFCH